MEPNLILDYMQRYFYSDITRDCRFRWTHLIELQKAIRHFEPEIIESLRADLGKAPQESYMTEIGMVLKEMVSPQTKTNTVINLSRNKPRHSGTLRLCTHHVPVELSLSAGNDSSHWCRSCRKLRRIKTFGVGAPYGKYH